MSQTIVTHPLDPSIVHIPSHVSWTFNSQGERVTPEGQRVTSHAFRMLKADAERVPLQEERVPISSPQDASQQELDGPTDLTRTIDRQRALKEKVEVQKDIATNQIELLELEMKLQTTTMRRKEMTIARSPEDFAEEARLEEKKRKAERRKGHGSVYWDNELDKEWLRLQERKGMHLVHPISLECEVELYVEKQPVLRRIWERVKKSAQNGIRHCQEGGRFCRGVWDVPSTI